jgi:basic membrane lipoprotein Med (substrate-binding protein (PBP1-ABC) superfamily)
MKRTILVLAGTACLALLPAGALGQQDSTARTDNAKTTVTETHATATADQSSNNDNHGKSKKNKKKSSAKKDPAKEPTENEKIFDEMLRSAAGGGL